MAVPTNGNRRDAAKRKLEEQLAQRERAQRQRTRLTIGGSVLAVVLIATLIVGGWIWNSRHQDHKDQNAQAATNGPTWPAPKTKPATVNCAYPKSTAPAAKPNIALPQTTGIRTTGTSSRVSVSMETSQGPIGLMLDPTESPCTVNSFASLVGQKYFDGTKCHRLTTEGIKVLQCGDPSGTGAGGPGYEFANEYPTDQFAKNDPKSQTPRGDYKRGVIAMANAGPGTNGSQFFLVYGDSPLPPQYTVFGEIDANGLKTLDKIAAGGINPTNGPGDGAPKQPVTITRIALD